MPGAGVVYVNDPDDFSVELLWMSKRFEKHWGFTPRPAAERPRADTHAIERTVRIAAPPQAAWDVIADHERMSEWIGLGSVRRTVDGAPDPDGRGSERLLKLLGVSVTEQVVAYEPPTSYRYRVTKGSPFVSHQGEIRLRADGDHTELTWTIRFRPKLPGTGRPLAIVLSRLLARVLRTGLKPYIETHTDSHHRTHKEQPDMTRFDITQTNAAVERLIETTENPRHLYLLHAYNRHRYLEMAGRYQEIFAPEMTVAHPVYHFNVFGMNVTLDGREQVEAVYREWTRTAQCVFYTNGDERLAVGDNMICSTATIYQQTPGAVLAATGEDVDPDAMYLVGNVEHMIWPYDDQGRLIGEDVWEIDDSRRELIKLRPDQVLMPHESAKLLEPLIKPLPVLGASHQPATVA